jgi:hypothetical protein
MRRPSPLIRVGRALLGLVTLWCLGCSSYEPILGSLFGNAIGAKMDCGTDMSMSSASEATPTAPDDGQPAILAASNARSFDCGCGGSCHAPSPEPSVVATMIAPMPTAEPHQPSVPAAVTRAPLLPPPELAV